MSTHESTGYKPNDEPLQTKYMHYCGKCSLRKDPANQTDGLSGSLPLSDSDLQAISAKPNDRVRLVVEHGDDRVETERKIHADGRSVTLPTKYRQKLNLELGDEVDYWIDFVERGPDKEDNKSKRSKQQILTDDTKQNGKKAVRFPGEDIYHYVGSSGAEETICKIDLSDKEYMSGQEPTGGLLELCNDCSIRSSEDMSNEELVDWLSSEIGFEKSGGPPSYFNKQQLGTFRDYILERNDEISSLKKEIDKLEKKLTSEKDQSKNAASSSNREQSEKVGYNSGNNYD